MKWNVINKEGKESSSVELNDEIYGVELNASILHSVVKAYRANRRQGTHATKTRSLISGGGKKPFKQKGTGNARQGSSRSPLMEGGAVAHGPQPRSYTQKTNKKLRQNALRVALSDKVRNKAFFLVDNLAMESYKTKDVVSLLSNLGLSGKKALIVDSHNSDHLLRSARNIKGVSVANAELINTENVLGCSAVILSKESLENLSSRLNNN